ncbi:ABC transporter permease [Rhizobium viscosum]|uniref:Ribose transport system permease protein n=1 Tax=Rhizobium viscosum TaxID=1673 RepID=A0ABR9IYD9_RHIVS|nr:ABC transporter permease [Rhizobium viscosum]MBE1508188.1 ribose transport system permease protein [Rhizobium viscosum]
MAPIDNDSPVPDAGRHSLLGLLTRGPTQLGLLIILLILWFVFTSVAPGFLSRFNLNSMGRSVAIDVVVGFAQMVVLATGGMNLSVGAIGVCCVMIAGYLMQAAGLPIPVSILLTLAFGGLLGALNGLAIVKTGVNSFIVTLASASLFSGGMLIFTKGVPLNGLPATFGAFGRSGVGPVPSLAIVALLIGALLYILFKHTVLGRQILAVGANARTAEMSGIPVGRITIFVHVLSGVLAGAAALMLTSRLSAAMPAVAGDDWLLPSFLAPVIGGTALAGGMVSVIGTILGALLVATIRSGLLVLQVGNFWLQLFLGVFLLSAILFERYRAKLAIREQTRRA